MLELIAIIVSCAALVIALLGNDKVVALLKPKSKTPKSPKDMEEKEGPKRDAITELREELKQQTEELKQLREEIASLQSRLTQVEVYISEQPSTPEIVVAESVAESKPAAASNTGTFYVQQIGDKSIDEASLLGTQTKFTKFILNVNGDEATFEVPTDAECQQRLLNGYSSIRSFVVEDSKVDSPTAIENASKGTLKKENGVWKLTSPLRVNLK